MTRLVEQVPLSIGTSFPDEQESPVKILDTLNAPPEVLDFLAHMGSKSLEVYARALIQGKVAKDYREALEQAAIKVASLSPSEALVKGDFSHDGRRNIWTPIRRSLGDEIPKAEITEYTRHGRAGHEVIGRTIHGFYPGVPLLRQPRKPEVRDQQTFFERIGLQGPSQKSVSEEKERAEYIERKIATEGGNLFNVIHLEDLAASLASLRELYKVESLNHPALLSVQHQLTELLRAGYPKQVREIEEVTSEKNKHLIPLSLMTWASAVLKIHQNRWDQDNFQVGQLGRQPCFLEGSLLDNHGTRTRDELSLGGGRYDALVPMSVGGEPLTPEHHRFFAWLATQKTTSIRHLVGLGERILGKRITFKLVDFKFMVGDNTSLSGLMNPDDVPFSKHIDQMYWYQVVADIAMAEHVNGIWTPESRIEIAELWHFFADREPVVSNVTLNPEGRRRYFIERLASTLPTARARANYRQLESELSRHAQLALRSANSHNKSLNGREDNQTVAHTPSIVDGGRQRVTLEEVFDLYRGHDMDRVAIRHYIGGKEKCRIQYGPLLRAIEKGSVITSRSFDPEVGGLICCPFHQEKTASCSVSFTKDGNVFHCFGCQRSGPVDVPPGTIFAELSFRIKQRVATNEKAARVKVSKESPMIWTPELYREHQLMTVVQEYLARALYVTDRGRNYLKNDRTINLELAEQLGFGYGIQGVIKGVIDRISDSSKDSRLEAIDRLRLAGIITYIPHPPESMRLSGLFRRYGLNSTDIRRNTRIKGQSVETTPYFPMQGRVTVPTCFFVEPPVDPELRDLKLDNLAITMFYGRAADKDEAKFKHTKTPGKYPQGGAFMTDIENAAGKTLILTEGVMDAISVKQMALQRESQFGDALALVGVSNHDVIAQVARRAIRDETRIGISLDADDTGREITELLIKELIELGVSSEMVFNYTTQFVAEHPDLEFKDINRAMELINRRKTNI